MTMGLRDTIVQDTRTILEDDTYGFGWSITLTDPFGKTELIKGHSTDISQAIDPDTGVLVSGRSASVAISIDSLNAVGFGLPKAIADSVSKPWVVEFEDSSGDSHVFKVAESNPDRAMGVVVCVLESYDG